ncbi:MAG: pilus assembly protein CpaF [Alphaproteobacteria bacterium]|nr:pilus assembly protein CpaF [Alphaproteobacteria bacterium]
MLHRLTIDAFSATSSTAVLLQEAKASQQLARCRMSVREGGLPAAIAYYADQGTPQLVIVEAEDPESLLTQLDQLANVCDAKTQVMIVGGRNDIYLYRTLLARGVNEYLPHPFSARQLTDSVSGLFSDARTAPRGRLVAFWGARGGVGASCMAQNTAWQLGQYLGEGVIYLDLDLAFGNSILAYNIEAKQTVADALQYPERLDEVLLERCLVDYDENLRILASAGVCSTSTTVTPEGIELLVDLAQRLAGFVVLDLPHLWTDWTKQCLAAADEVILTAQPDFASLRDCKTLLDLLVSSRGGAAKPKLVLNKVDASKKTQLAAKDFEDSIGLIPALSIPFEPALFGEASNAGQMIGESVKTHRVAQAFALLAQGVAGKSPNVGKAAARKGQGIWQWLKK